MAVEAIYFDGETARENRVNVKLDSMGLSFSGAEVFPQSWSRNGLTAVDSPQPRHSLRLAHVKHPGARLIIADEDFKQEVLALAPHLNGGFDARVAIRVAGWIASGIALFAGLLYLALNFAPQRIAVMLPDDWTRRVGDQMEASLVEKAKVCHTARGDAALSAMLGKLAEGNPDMPPIRVRVYDIPVMNAWTLPGGYIVLTRGLLNGADAADEVAGVLAHEIGHAANHHSEAQMVRIAGLQVLLSAASGSSSGSNIGNVAGLAAILRSSRDAEHEADAFAVAMLDKANLDRTGLRRFFSKVLAEEGKYSGSAFSKLGSLFSTHPGTEERIGMITPLPQANSANPALTNAQWNDLKLICGA